MKIALLILTFATFFFSPATDAADSKVTLALNWKPEAEFGGFYAAQLSGAFKAAGLDVTVLPGGVGTPVVQMVAAGKTELGIASADEVVISRGRGSDVIALFAVYQTCPQGIMAHDSSAATQLEQLFKGGTLALQKGLPFVLYLEKKYGFTQVKVVPFFGGVQQFLTDKNLSSQCFVTSEPIAARRKGVPSKVFLVADSGYNPYTTVLITRESYLKKNPLVVAKMLKGVRQGWADYLRDPTQVNLMMSKQNPTMDADTLKESAEIQKKLIETPETARLGVGAMTAERWKTLAEQLKDLKRVDKIEPGQSYFYKE